MKDNEKKIIIIIKTPKFVPLSSSRSANITVFSRPCSSMSWRQYRMDTEEVSVPASNISKALCVRSSA